MIPPIVSNTVRFGTGATIHDLLMSIPLQDPEEAKRNLAIGEWEPVPGLDIFEAAAVEGDAAEENGGDATNDGEVRGN